MKQSRFSIVRSPGRSFIACGLALMLSLYSLPLSAAEAFGAEEDAVEGQENGQQLESIPPAENGQAQTGSKGDSDVATDTDAPAVDTNTDAPAAGSEMPTAPEGEPDTKAPEQQPVPSENKKVPLVDEDDEKAVDPADVEEVYDGVTDENIVDPADVEEVYDGVSDEEIAEMLSLLNEPSEVSEDDGIALLSLSGSGGVKTYGGATMFETAVAEAKAAFTTSDTVILAGPGEAWVDALAAAGLAGALDCPILFVQNNSLHPATKQALKDLKVHNAIVLGGEAAISNQVVKELNSEGVALKDRLGGANCYGTQMKIYEYGKKNNLWNNDMVIVATGGHFGDALSASPIAYAKKVPIFLVDGGELPTPQKNALTEASKSGKFTVPIIVGGEAAVSKRAKGFLNRMGSCTRLWGATQYETSAAIAKWAVKSQGFTWNNAAFTTGDAPYDALAGSVLQGKSKSVMLLVGSTTSMTIKEASANKGSISGIRFFGGVAAVSSSLRTYIISCISNKITYEHAGLSSASMAKLEGKKASVFNPDQYGYEDDEFYQFAVVDSGYSGKVTAAQLNSFIARYGSEGKLAGMGQAFIDAAKTYGTNEVYLVAHAILESGWGKSPLAMGYKYNGKIKVNGKTYPAGTYYNFFGIGAVDSGPLAGGRALAIMNGWNTPEKAITGAAKWIAGGYLNNAYNQNTLYKMRWNYTQAARNGVVWKQYATSETWATGIAQVMADVYMYTKIDKADTGLTFLVPLYS